MLISAVLLLLITFLAIGAFSVSASDATSGYYTYTVSNGEATITDVDTAISGDVTIPSILEGYPVVEVGYYAFYNCKNITNVTIPDSVTTIGDSAFSDCNQLVSVAISDSVTSLGNRAFYNCTKLANITLPDSIISIYPNTFVDTAYYNNEKN